MNSRALGRALLLQLALLTAVPSVAQTMGPQAIAQIEGLIQEKRARTLAEQKLDSNLLYAARTISRRAAGDMRPTFPFVDAFITAKVAADQTVCAYHYSYHHTV